MVLIAISEYSKRDRPFSHVPECLDFKQGTARMNYRLGSGIKSDLMRFKLRGEITTEYFLRQDRSLTGLQATS